jgi:tetratricopeptide (TPR) repeat protein
VVFNKPIYIPYGKYIVELRQPKKIGDSGQFVEDIRFKREFTITEENPIFEISVTDDDLNKFPAEIKSVPDKADVFIDGQTMGQTPYRGDFPLGEHTLVLRKDGYFEHSQSLKMDINMLYSIEVPLQTTVAGQFINAGNLLYNKGLYKDAIAQFSEVFKNSPTEREIGQTQYLLGMSYLQMGDSATAMGYFEQARQREDFKYPAMLGMASIYGTLNNMAQALPLLVEVMLKSTDEQVKSDAHGVFRQLSPLRSVMYIYTDPEGATVVVNDKPIQQKTPLILHDLGLGNYKVRLQKDGFIPQELNINMSIAEFNPVIIKLKPIEQ